MRSALLFAWIFIAGRMVEAAPAGPPGTVRPGVRVAFYSPSISASNLMDVAVLPGFSAYFESGTSPTPFVPSGPFVSVWEGLVSVDLRGDYKLHVECRGDFNLVINSNLVLKTAASPGMTGQIASASVRLGKGANPFRAELRSAESGDTYLRVKWSSRESLPRPIPESALSHSAREPGSDRWAQRDRGRALFLERRCIRCHDEAATEGRVPELTMDAPALDGIGSRLRVDWMAGKILSPRAERADARMPRMFHGLAAPDAARLVAMFLSTLKERPSPGKDAAPDEDAGARLFDKLHCAGCHHTPGTEEADPGKVSLSGVRFKYMDGALSRFLERPDRHYAWIRMPDFRLSRAEARDLAFYLERKAHARSRGLSEAELPDPGAVDRGRKLVTGSGCLNCHALELANRFKPRRLADLTVDTLEKGCLSGQETGGGLVPRFDLTPEDREALRVFLGSDRLSLLRPAPMFAAQRQLEALRCGECHGKQALIPTIANLRGRLQPEWARHFLSGEVAEKPRPWLEARMPAFRPWAATLSEGLAALGGHGRMTITRDTPDPSLAAVGRKLVSAEGGFSCVSCHAIGGVASGQIIENHGIDLARTGERLIKDYFMLWVANPLQVDPATKMPVYFDEQGRSPLADVFEGDGQRQLEALWMYISHSPQPPPR